MLSPREEYALLKDDALRLLRGILRNPRDEVLDELILALADYPVELITDEARDLLKDNIKYWVKGYAVPVTVLKELGIINPEKKAKVILTGEDISVEPDVNYDFALEFTSRIKAREVLDIASGFGWIPPLFSKNAKVYALDKAYLNKVIYQDDRIFIEGTTIELFPDSRPAREYIRRERKLKDYRDFAILFWKTRKAKISNIILLQGDAANLQRCKNISENREHAIEDDTFETVTCFFAFNHIPSWKPALREIYRVLKKGGETWVTLYREYLKMFPVKFAYDWTEQLGIKIIKIGDFREQAEKEGFKVNPIKKYRGAALYHLLRLIK